MCGPGYSPVTKSCKYYSVKDEIFVGRLRTCDVLKKDDDACTSSLCMVNNLMLQNRKLTNISRNEASDNHDLLER